MTLIKGVTVTYKYLHSVGESTFWLDHRLTPEVSAMFCAMASRAPVGGIRARYEQVVEAVAESLYEDWDALVTSVSWADAKVTVVDDPRGGTIADYHRLLAEDRLCEYPLHPRVQKFFDDFVLRYGHSSIMELTGRPAVYSENISWFTAWQLFDSPLCAGQEFSTRAVQHADWPMARECGNFAQDTSYGNGPGPSIPEGKYLTEDGSTITVDGHGITLTTPNTDLVALHRDWFEVFEAEVAWWKDHLSDEANRLALGIGDKEPFRPALDRARWALPGTIATGCAHTTSLRERARVLKDGSLLAQASGCSSSVAMWDELAEAYREALPGLAGMGLREAVYTPESNIPGHLTTAFTDAPDGPDVEVTDEYTDGLFDVPVFKRTSNTSYLDPAANTVFRVGVTFRCSLAVARDWHRHRTLYPWHLQVVRATQHVAMGHASNDEMSGTFTVYGGTAPFTIPVGTQIKGPHGSTLLSSEDAPSKPERGPIQIDHHYEPRSDLAKAKLHTLLRRSTEVFDTFMAEGNLAQAALALPLGTRVRMRGQGGLRDVLYMLELRKHAVGANFEYKDQATVALASLQQRMQDYVWEDAGSVAERFGIDP